MMTADAASEATLFSSSSDALPPSSLGAFVVRREDEVNQNIISNIEKKARLNSPLQFHM